MLSDEVGETQGDEGSQQNPAESHGPANAFADWAAAHPKAFTIGIWTVVGASIAFGTFMWATGRLELHNVGYAGVLAVNVIGSASVIVPVPGLAVVCGAAPGDVGLNPVLLGLAGGFGSTVGEMTGYLAGYGGNVFVQRSKHYDRFRGMVVKRGGLALFVLSVIPNPVFDIAGIAAGSLRYPLRRFLLYVLAGKAIKFIVVAYACRQGIDWIIRLT